MKKILVIDNYDSFTYNLVYYIEKLTGLIPSVYRNDEITLEDVEGYDKILLSPGPGVPVDAGVCIDLIREYAPTKSILGICLGHQAIGAAFGARVVRAARLMHGKVSTITSDGKAIYEGVASPFEAMRYHSLAVSREDLPSCLEVTAESEDGEIMGIRHREHATEGIQFHPESIMTPVGKRLLRNFLKGLNGKGGKRV